MNTEDKYTYEIKRFHAPGVEKDDFVTQTGLTREEAVAHCESEESEEEGVWFEGFNKE